MVSVEELSVLRIGPLEGENRQWCVTWNHNGTLLASCGEDKAVRVWKKLNNAPYLERASVIDGSHNRAIRSVSFSNSGRYLVSASFDATVVVYQREDGEFEEVNKLEGHESEVKAAVFSPSDEFLATCSRDKSVWFWQMDEDEDFQVCSVLQPHSQDVKTVVWHPYEQLLVSCSYDSSIRFYKFDGDDWITQQKIDQAHEGTVWSAAFDGQGNRLVTVGEDHAIQLWRRSSLEGEAVNSKWEKVARHVVEDLRWPFYSVSWGAQNGLIAVAAGDRTIRLFSVEKTECEENFIPLQTIRQHDGDVNCVAWNPVDNQILASASDDGTIRLFNITM